MEEIKVLVVDDHPLIRQGLCKVLELEEKINVVGEAGDGSEALEKVRALQPDVILMDINMPDVNGIEAIGLIKKEFPRAKIIMLTIHDDDEYVLETMKTGAAGYVLKDVEPRNLIEAIRVVHKGGSYIHPTIAAKLMGEINRLSVKKSEPLREELTRRELEVLNCLAKGYSNREIAKELYISEKTVKNHISNIFHKLNVSDRTQALIQALKLKLVNLQ